MREDYLELHRHHAPAGDDQHQRAARHLQKCLTALEQIRAIAGNGPIAQLALAAMQNQPHNAGGTELSDDGFRL